MLIFHRVLPKELSSGRIIPRKRQACGIPQGRGSRVRDAGCGAAGPSGACGARTVPHRAGGSKDKGIAREKSDFVTRQAEKDPGRQVLFLPGLDAEQTSC